jgi:hypothetical protein
MRYFIIYWEGDGEDRESYSIFYSSLVIAVDENDAWNKWDKVQESRQYYNIREVDPIV